MKNMLFPIRRLLGGVAALSLMVSPTLQAFETNFNFNASTDAGWERWLPEFYGVNDGSGNFTNGANLPTITFTTNNSSAGNMAYAFHSGTTNSGLTAAPKLGSIITNGPSLTNFTMTGECFTWTNGQGQEFGIVARVQLPLPPVNAPNTESFTNTANPLGLAMFFANARSAKNYQSPPLTGSSDNLRIVWLAPGGYAQLGNNPEFNGPGVNGNVGVSPSPNPTNGHYRMILTANGNDITGQFVDLSTGLPMPIKDAGWYVANVATNILRTSYTNVFYTNNVWNEANSALTNFINVGGAYGFIASLGSSGYSAPIPGNNTVGQPIDPHFDNFAIVPGVVTLESAAVVNGTYTQDDKAGIEVSPKRITIPVNGSTRFYRINWIGADHTPTITGITPGATVSVVTGGGGTTPYATNVVKTMVVTYN